MTRAPAWRRLVLLPSALALVLVPAVQSAQADAPPPDGRSATGHLTRAPAGENGTGDASGTSDANDTNRTSDASRTVTLLTGDRVTVTDLGGGKKTVSVDRPKGATGAVRTQTSNGDISVIPDEARPYLDAGTLDPRLFDVTGLIDQGLADPQGHAATGLPLIVTYGGRAARSTPAAPRGTTKVRSLPSIDATAVRAGKDGVFWNTVTGGAGARSKAATALAAGGTTSKPALSGGVAKVWLDGRVKADMAESNAQIGTPDAWAAGLTGKGVKVAVLDTGADTTHPDLAGRISTTKSFIDGEEVADRNGHGTHTTSTLGGDGAASDGKEKGVAPDADLAVGKVLSDEGTGTESQIIAGMEWAAQDVHARVVSMSLGSDTASDGTDPMSQAVNTLSEQTGALFVIAAGNYGNPMTIGSPGAADDALTVGAVDSADAPASFSSQGPRLGDHALKPDISAPGVDILAARSQLVEGDGPYTTMSGTSMATPHVAGAAALLAQEHPDWTGSRLKDALMSSSEQLGESVYTLGAGRVSVPDAIHATITATGSADLGFYKWPYDSDRPVTRTLTYANSSDGPVTLALTAKGAADGVVTLADSTLTVPAHGTARTTVTGDGAGAPVGNTSGRITATAGGAVVAHTAFGLVKEEERYSLTVHVTDRDGAPAPADLALEQLTAGAQAGSYAVDDSGTLTLRLPPGHYAAGTFLDVRGSHGADSLGLGFLAAPDINLDRDRSITLDGTTLREIRADVAKRTETRHLLMEFDRADGGADFGGSVLVPLTYDSVFAAPTKKVGSGTFEYRTVWRLAKPLLEASTGGKDLADATLQSGTTPLDGRFSLPVTDAGGGTAGDYTGKNVKGGAVLVHATSDTPAAQLAQNAQDAGAKALFVTDDTPGRLMAWFGTDAYENRPLAVATVDAADGALLVKAAAGHREVTLTGTPSTPYVYDLSKGYPGAIPDTSLVYRPGKRDLGTVTTTFYGGKAATGGEFRYSITGTFRIGFGFPEAASYPSKRTDYVTSASGQTWMESVTQGGTDGTALEERSGLVAYPGGKTTDRSWFKPVLHPWLGTGLGWGQTRAGNDIQFNTPGWGDSGPDHTGFGDVYSVPSMTQTTEVLVDGVSVGKGISSAGYVWDADPAEHTYTVVTDTALDGSVWDRATAGHTTWTVRSKETPADRQTYLPMLNLGFDVPADLAGDVRAGKKATVGLSAEYVVGAAGTGTIGGGSLSVSYDGGKSWTPVALKKAHGSGAAWTGRLSVPKNATSVSFTASVRDDQGGSVTQRITDALGVK